MKKSFILALSAILLLLAGNAGAQSRYCNTYEDFVADRWVPVDTIYITTHSKGRQIWIGGNDYSMSADDKATKKTLKKKAFAVMQGDALYVNCHGLRYQKTRFPGGGYAKAMRTRDGKLILVNKIIGKEPLLTGAAAGTFFGAIGGGLAAANQVSQQVCYLVDSNANEKGHTAIRLIKDEVMDELLSGREDLRAEYYAVKEPSQRVKESHILPILKKAGIL